MPLAGFAHPWYTDTELRAGWPRDDFYRPEDVTLKLPWPPYVK